MFINNTVILAFPPFPSLSYPGSWKKREKHQLSKVNATFLVAVGLPSGKVTLGMMWVTAAFLLKTASNIQATFFQTSFRPLIASESNISSRKRLPITILSQAPSFIVHSWFYQWDQKWYKNKYWCDQWQTLKCVFYPQWPIIVKMTCHS